EQWKVRSPKQGRKPAGGRSRELHCVALRDDSCPCASLMIVNLSECLVRLLQWVAFILLERRPAGRDCQSPELCPDGSSAHRPGWDRTSSGFLGLVPDHWRVVAMTQKEADRFVV